MSLLSCGIENGNLFINLLYQSRNYNIKRQTHLSASCMALQTNCTSSAIIALCRTSKSYLIPSRLPYHR